MAGMGGSRKEGKEIKEGKEEKEEKEAGRAKDHRSLGPTRPGHYFTLPSKKLLTSFHS